MKEPRTDFGKALVLITMPLRIIGWLAIGAGQSFAVLVGTAWLDSRGGFHWRDE